MSVTLSLSSCLKLAISISRIKQKNAFLSISAISPTDWDKDTLFFYNATLYENIISSNIQKITVGSSNFKDFVLRTTKACKNKKETYYPKVKTPRTATRFGELFIHNSKTDWLQIALTIFFSFRRSFGIVRAIHRVKFKIHINQHLSQLSTGDKT